MKILSIDARAESEGGWTWNRWYHIGTIDKATFETLDSDKSIDCTFVMPDLLLQPISERYLSRTISTIYASAMLLIVAHCMLSNMAQNIKEVTK